MAGDMFIKIEGIPGESTDDKHKDWIEVLTYSHSLSQPSAGARSTGGAATGGRCHHDDLVINKTMDKASPKLALFCSNGSHIPSIVLELCRATGDKSKYMEYKMTDVIISSVSVGGGSGDVPTETVSFNYGKIEWTYTETDHKTGKPKGNVASHWDLVANKGG